MTDQDLLKMLKANLEKRNKLDDEYLEQLITAAKASITREGITLSESEYTIDEANIIVMYAAFLYDKRRSTAENYKTAAMNPQGMPYMLRYALNNMLFSQKMKVTS